MAGHGIPSAFITEIIKSTIHQMPEKIGKKNRDVEINYESKDEIGLLSAAFRNLRDKISGLIQDLNSTNQDLNVYSRTINRRYCT
ncbi:MAG: hypothetical protein K8R21_00555 [Leptospira sp.]|nr:hypothetical protein [Leptospira sp.]